jgi:shikimate dehydrogenase
VPDAAPAGARTPPLPEIGGAPGPDPTRFGDWEKNGRCIDF